MSINTIPRRPTQRGSSLLEVLVTVLILSFGMLALGGMMSYAVQMPKLSGYRASATSIAAGHIERMRANLAGFRSSEYASAKYPGESYTLDKPSWGALVKTTSDGGECIYPNCTPEKIALVDINETHRALRRELPGFAGIRVICNGACDSLSRPEGDLWVLWYEPTTFASLDGSSSDACPDPNVAPSFTAFTNPFPRCLHVRFKL